jgi:zinc transporter 1
MTFTREVRLLAMLGLTGTMFLTELIVGYISGSIALIADSFHMLSDLLALLVAVYAVRVCFFSIA